MMRVRKKGLILFGCAIITLLWNLAKFGDKTSRQMQRLQARSYDFHPEVTEMPPEPRLRYADVQLLVDKSTVVYVGYYDNREEPVVKIPAFFNMMKTISNFTCTLHYANEIPTKVEAQIRLLTYSWMGNMANLSHRTALIICPLSQENPIPSYVLLAIDGINNEITNVTVKPPAHKNNTLTRCIKQFCNAYDNVTQLVWNIEFYRILGVDKQIFYLNNQTQRVLDVLKIYEKEEVVELRSFDLAKLPIKSPEHELEFMVLQECLLSEMNTAKYVLFVDVDEVIFPRSHRDIVQMADFLFQQGHPDGKQLGSLRFHLAFYPVDNNITDTSFPNKETAEKYNIDPLLHTKRYKTVDMAGTKSLVKPKSVDVMFVHVVETFISDECEMSVNEDFGVLNHYRKGTKNYLEPPVFTNTEVYRFSDDLIAAVVSRYRDLHTVLRKDKGFQ